MRLAALICFFFVSACAAQDNRAWFRQDGQTMIGRPDLVKKFELDVTACNGESSAIFTMSRQAGPARQNAADDVMRGCMAQRGYVLREPQGAPTASLR